MNFNNPMRRSQWSPSTETSFESQSIASTPDFQGSSSSTGRANVDSNISTTTTMEALGIRIWPPGLQPPGSAVVGRPRAAPEQTYASTYSTNYPRPSSWNTYGVHLPQHYSLPPDVGGFNDYLFLNSVDGSLNEQKATDESLDFSSLEADLGAFQNELLPAEEDPSLMNMRKHSAESDQELLVSDTNDSKRLSGSSFSLSSAGGASIDVADMSTYSDAFSYPSDYTPRSSLNLSSTVLSAVPSPRCPPTEAAKAGSRSRASPSPRPNARTAPYSLDGARKRWSTGSFGPSPALRASPFWYHNPESFQRTPNLSGFSAPSITSNSVLPSSNLASPQVLGSSPARFHRGAFLLPSNSDGRFSNSVRLFSQGPFRTLHSSVDPHGHCLDHYANLSEPPDLLGPLRKEQVAPPPEDLHPEDPDLVPHKQELRFENDMYTPKWVRGHGNKREGWCGICKPGRWLVLKNSAFWYDKSFTHGVSAATGQAFELPRETRRMEGNADVWEGLCGSCGEWIALVSSKKKGTTWFRHAYKCHTHPKIKDVPKRRRENAAGYGRPSTATSSPKSTTLTPSVKVEAMTPGLVNSGISDSALSGVKTVSPLHTITSMI